MCDDDHDVRLGVDLRVGEPSKGGARPDARGSSSRPWRAYLFVQRAHVLLQHRYSLFVRHRSPFG